MTDSMRINEQRLQADRNAWKSAANHLMVAIRMIDAHQLDDEQQIAIAIAVNEYNTAKQGISQ